MTKPTSPIPAWNTADLPEPKPLAWRNWTSFLGPGIVMMGIFGHVFVAPFRRLTSAVAAKNWKEGGAALGQIRRLVAVNLTLGLVTIAIAAVGAIFV